MSDAIQGLEPKLVWKIFQEISQIPRCSKNEQGVLAFLKQKAWDVNLETPMDEIGNLCVKVPATKGYKDAPVTILQGHLDMVCTKNADVDFDFANDPIRLVRDGDWLKADGTTLGADNGIGVAAAMAVALDSQAVHGPLELLFTIDEETGLTGALGLSEELVDGRILLNLDSEEMDLVYMGCAGGSGVNTRLPINWTAPSNSYAGAKLSIKGLRGGHSGADIHENRGNAICLLARALYHLTQFEYELADFASGDKHNAIPREGHAHLAVADSQFSAMTEKVKNLESDFRKEYNRDSNLSVTLEKAETPDRVFSEDSASAAIRMLLAFPCGVEAMSQDLENLVETSNNIAIAHLQGDALYVHNSPRSSLAEAMRGTLDKILAAGELAGAKNEEEESYPGWQPNPDSRILNLVENVHLDLFGKAAERRAIHAGLECGVIGEKFEQMDMVSFGPEINNPHSPDEVVQISTVDKFYRLLLAVLEAIAKGK